MTALTVTVGGSVNITWNGWTSNPGGGGGGTITGSGVAGQNTYWTGATAIGGDAQNTWNAITHTAQIGTTQPDMPNFPSLSIYNQALSIQQNTATGSTPAVFYSYDVSGVAKSSGAGGTQSYTSGLGTSAGWNTSSEVSPGAGQSLAGGAASPDSIGQIGYATTNGPATATTSFAAGFQGYTENFNAGTLTWGVGFIAQASRNTGGGALTNAAGNYFRAQTAGTNNYGAYFEDFGAGANTFGIFQVGTNTKNTFAHITAVDVATGTSPPTCTPGTAGVVCQNEGTAPTGAAGVDMVWADATNHCLHANNNNVDVGCLIATSSGGALPTGNKIHSTGNVAAISTATLCASTSVACGTAGQYHVSWAFIETGTACGTPGTGGVTLLLTWTDSNTTTHSAVSVGMDDASAINAVSQTFHFQTSLAAAWASGDFNISTNGAVVQYATGYTACGVGTGTYQLDVAVTRLQ